MRILACCLLMMMYCLTGCGNKEQKSPSAPEPTSTSSTPEAPTKTPATDQSAPVDQAANPILGKKLLTAEEIAAGWISLFDGETLFGWKSSHDDINWNVANGAITADTGSNGALLTTVPFADFELVCDYRLPNGGNSGIFVRSSDNPTNPAVDFYEINIVDKHPEGFLTGSLAMRKKGDVEVKSDAEWHTLRIVAQGKTLKVWHDKQAVLEFTDESDSPLLNGRIGLQKNSGKIEFRKVNLKPLDLQPLFNEKDLTGWREVPGSKSKFAAKDGAIHVIDGAGFLETEKTFQNFIFQTDVKTQAKDLNSGFFFRALEGTEKAPSNGYEVQVHNGFKDGNRNKPANAGTGAIFRRVEARRVVGNDLEWDTITLVTAGPQISVWVNGFQEVDWIDPREPHENPRQGRRVEGGHISLQGHDPTTDVLFRNLKAKEQ